MDEADVAALLDGRRTPPFHLRRRHAFHRATRRGAPFVLKSMQLNPPDAIGIASLRHEYELLRGLDVPGIVKVVALAQNNDALVLVMEDVGSSNLAAHVGAGPLPVDGFLEIALQLAQSVAGLHRAGIVHRNIGPANIVWNVDARRATLIDFQIATSLSTLEVDKASPARLEGALSYMSPEQTGRVGRSVDSRSDLYSLGATFYFLLTGAPPFIAQDPVELVHALLARSPRPPHLIDAGIPPVLSGIVLKLLEKEPEKRYRTAGALVADLQRVDEQWTGTGGVEPFLLAESDGPRELAVPAKLYGRTEALGVLQKAFERACDGRRELVLVTGAPGIGKTALVNRLEEAAIGQHGYFIAGKFDQLQRSVPYAGLVPGFRSLVRHLLTKSDATLATWRERIRDAVGPNGRILVDLIPEMEAVLGPQPPIAPLGPVEAKNRFGQVFTSFLGVLARPEHPLVLFLDDLQWVDAASLQLIQQWIGDDESGHLLIVGAYRDNEIGVSDPLALALAELHQANIRPATIHLGALSLDDVVELVGDTFNQPPGMAAPLAEMVAKKTAGNPFFISRLLREMHRETLVRFVPRDGTWQWNMDEIGRAPVSDNVLDLMVKTIDRLPERTRTLLQVGACIGYRFDLDTLAEVTGRSRATALDELWPALEDGLLLPLGEAYKAPRRAGLLDTELTGLCVDMRFVHDRVQQAALSSLIAVRRQTLHLDIGRTLLRHVSNARRGNERAIDVADRLAGTLFDVVDQLNLGEAVMTDPLERLGVAELNLAAGRRAKASAAYQAAFDYLDIGRRQLPVESWRTHADLTFCIHRELAECAYLAGQHAAAERILEAALEHAPSRSATVDLYSLRVLAATVAGDWSDALRWGREGLAVFGLEWPLEGLAQANDAEASAVMRNVGARRVEDLVTEPELDDEDMLACMRLLSILGPPAYFSGSPVLTFLLTRGVNLSLLHGASVYSAYAYVFYGAIHNARTEEYDVGYAFGKLALAMAQRFDNRAEESRTLEVFGLLVHAWRAPLRESFALMREGHRAGVESGELAYAAFNLCALLINRLPAGVKLADLAAEADVSIAFATKHHNRTGIEISLPFRQFARTLMGGTPSPTRFDDASFDESRFLEEAAGNHTAIGQFWVARLQAAYLLNDHGTARHSARQGAGYTSSGLLGMVTSVEHVFYAALTLAVEHTTAPADRQAALLDEVGALLAQLVVWAGHSPENFQHKRLLVEAELERMGGSPWRAMELFGKSIDGAQKQGFMLDEALANELAGKLFLAYGQPRLAAPYLDAARDGYENWGATVKVDALDAAHPDLLRAPMERVGSMPSETRLAYALDAMGLIKASQAIAAETVPDQLFERILQIVVEVAGAQTGMLLLGPSTALRVRARVTVREETVVTLEDMPLADCFELPHAVVRYVARLGEPVVLSDAAVDGLFAASADVRALRLRSVLCLPLKKYEQVVGLLYLENNAMAGVFTRQRVEVVQALAAQAAISLENSTLLLERERAETSARFLAGAGTALAESLDRDETLARIGTLTVPELADWCFLDLFGDDEKAQRVQVAHADPGQAELAEALKHVPLSAFSCDPYPQGQAPGKEAASLTSPVPVERLRSMVSDEAYFQLLRAVAPRSLIRVPLITRGRTLGVLTLIAAQSGRTYDEASLDVARKLGERCALAMDNASLFQKAQQAIRVREDFLAVASHELKTPLMPLQLQIQLIERRLPSLIENEQSGEWLSRSLKTLQRQGKRLERLVNELLDISRIAGGPLQLKLESVDLAAVARQVVERLEEGGEVSQSGSTLTVRCAAPVAGRWDPFRVEQVITNLVSNALKYGEGHPVELEVTSDGAHAVIEVTDHGLGIAPEHIGRIFGRFERAVSSRQYGGLGLGLYIVNQIVTAMAGSIVVSSMLGEGSTFTVMLPLAWAQHDKRHADELDPDHRFHGEDRADRRR